MHKIQEEAKREKQLLKAKTICLRGKGRSGKTVPEERIPSQPLFTNSRHAAGCRVHEGKGGREKVEDKKKQEGVIVTRIRRASA